MIERTRLKGGSLSATELLTFPDSRKVVRKSISRHQDREYGFVRWHSQMKRLQRYESMFPGLFPALLDVSVEDDQAYFDLEYVDGSVDLKNFLADSARTEEETRNVCDDLFEAMHVLHAGSAFHANRSLELYYFEEVLTKFEHAREHSEFRQFCDYPDYIFNGRSVPNLGKSLDGVSALVKGLAPAPECYTHGNMTLENILYVPHERRIVFVDPYDENIVDCREAEYSQVLQCSNSHYGFVNDRDVVVSGNKAAFEQDIPDALRLFNDLFLTKIRKSLSPQSMKLVDFFEFSQFVRMLPFKVAAGDIEKAKYFLCLASDLANKLVAAESVNEGEVK